jgi:Methyltransferase domain
MTLPRRVEPEWLDQLPADDPSAIRSRRDLKRLNVLILQSRIMASALTRHWGPNPPRSLVDLGAGDGTFMLSIAQRLASRWPEVNVTLLDRQNIVSSATREAFAALGWNLQTMAADVFEYLAQMSGCVDVMTTNLFLHHFTDEPLTRLLAMAARSTQLFVACEPRRTKFAVRSSRLLWVIACNDVSCHDAVVSVRAGFSGNELSKLWPSPNQWQLHEHPARLFSHCFVARRPATPRLA